MEQSLGSQHSFTYRTRVKAFQSALDPISTSSTNAHVVGRHRERHHGHMRRAVSAVPRNALIMLLLIVLLHVLLFLLLPSPFSHNSDADAATAVIEREIYEEELSHGCNASTHLGDISLIIPIDMAVTDWANTNTSRRSDHLLAWLLAAEADLCYRRPQSEIQPVRVHAIIALTSTLEVGEVSHGDELDADADADGTTWHVWRRPLRSVSCLNRTVTIIGKRHGGAQPVEMPTMAALVDAALRTRAGRAGSHFITLPHFLRPTRAAYTLLEDLRNETRHEGPGFIEALVEAATRRNEGRIIAVQCTIIQPRTATGGEISQRNRHFLSARDLRAYTVVDRGGFVGSASSATDATVLPFLARRHNGYAAADQRVMQEEPIEASSLFCGLFSRCVFDLVAGGGGGGFATVGEISPLPPSGTARTIHNAGDAAGWKLSLAAQLRFPTWQVYTSRAVAIWTPTRQGAMHDRTLNIAVYALTDAYGRNHAALFRRLEARRYGRPWAQRTLPLSQMEESDPSLPPILSYWTDYPCACCGLAREAASYIRPLCERYSVGVEGASRDFCDTAGARMMAMAYHIHRPSVFGVLSEGEKKFWKEQSARRARVSILHVRADKYTNVRRHIQQMAPPPLTGVRSVFIGRSLTEFSDVPRAWVQPLRQEMDEVWPTSPFFSAIYLRHGVPSSKIRVVPEAVDVYLYDPANYEREAMPPHCIRSDTQPHDVVDSMPWLTAEERRRRFVFVSVFKWEDRKGWDVLIGAYWDAFGPHSPAARQNCTTLVLKVNFDTDYAGGLTPRTLGNFLAAWARRTASIPNLTGLESLPHVIVIGGTVTESCLLRLYASADAFVLPSRGEGWCLPLAEAMAMGLAVITTQWGGLLALAGADTTFHIAVDATEEVPSALRDIYKLDEGTTWAVPSRNSTAELMRYVVEHPAYARLVGRRARTHVVAHYSQEAVADLMDADIAAALRRKGFHQVAYLML